MRKVYFYPLFIGVLLFLSGNILLAQPPEITGQTIVPSIQEDTFIDLDINQLIVADNDPGFPTGFALVVKPGSNYTFEDTRVTPDLNFNGPLAVKVTVTDPEMLESEEHDFQVDVSAVNDLPVIEGQVNMNVEIPEESTHTISPSDLIITDPDVGDMLTVTITSGANFTASGADLTPDQDYFGPLQADVVVNDGTGDSNQFTYNLLVNNVNDAPTMNDVAPLNLNAGETGDALLTGIFSGAVNENDLLQVTFEDNSNPGLFNQVTTNYVSPDAEGSITFETLAGTSGTSDITVRLSDGQASVDKMFAVSVQHVNASPTIDPIADANIDEDASEQVVSLTGITPGSGEGGIQTVTVEAESSLPGIIPHPTVAYDGTSTTGELRYQPLANQFTTGGPAVVITVRVTDNEDPPSQVTESFNVVVNSVNDLPVIAGQVDANPEILEESTLTISPSDLIITDPDDDTFSVTIEDGANYAASGADLTPDQDYFGPLLARLRVDDGEDNSAPYDYNLTVNNVNDPPTLNNIGNLDLTENGSAGDAMLSGITTGAANENDVLTVTVENNTNTSLFSSVTTNYTSPDEEGSITFTPAPDMSGNAGITVRVSDGEDFVEKMFTVSIQDVNASPFMDDITDATIPEDAPEQLVQLTGITAGPGEDGTQSVTLEAESSAPTVIPAPTITYGGGSMGQLRYQPAANQFTSGGPPAVITVRVRDSEVPPLEFTQSFNVVVSSVNDPPVISGQVNMNVEIDEESTHTITPADLVITDPDDNTFTVSIADGPNYAASDDELTPVVHYYGPIVAGVTVNDGEANSNSHDYELTVINVNDPPTLGDIDDLDISEGETGQVDLTGITTGAPNESDDLNVTIQGNSNPGLFADITTNYASPQPDGSIAFTAANNASGTSNVTVRLSDGEDFVDRSFTVSVEDVNATPFVDDIPDAVINEDAAEQNVNLTNISAGSGEEGQPVSITAVSSNPAIITDPTISHDGTSATGTLSYQPVANQFTNGTPVTITVTVTDSEEPPLDYVVTFTVTVNPVNDPPSITGQNTTPSTDEETPIALNIAHLNVTDVDNPPLTGFTLNVKAGTGYTVGSGTTITPNANVTGTIDVVVSVTDPDGGESPNFNTFKVTVDNVNDPPTITGQNTTPSTNEESPIALNIAHLNVTDVDNTFPTGFTLNVKSGTGYTVGSGTTITPNMDVTGTIDVVVSVTDPDGAESADHDFEVMVNEVNDLPTINPIADVTVPENSLLQNVSFNGVSDGSDNEVQITTVSVTYTNPSLFLAVLPIYVPGAPSGNINITPNLNTSGSSTFTVTVSDGVDEITEEFVFTVTSVNDPPAFNDIVDISVNEDAGQQEVDITGVTPGPGETQNITFTAVSSNPTLIPNPSIAYTQGETEALLTFQSAANQSGSAVITVTAEDADGLEFTDDFTIDVTPVNDAPTIATPATLDIAEDAAQQGIPLTGITAGPLESQMLTVSVSAANMTLFDVLDVVYTSPGATGTLNIKPAANQTGSTQVTITVTDDGPGTSPHDNTTEVNFTVNVNAVNDPPEITGQDAVSVNEDTNFTILVTHLDIEDLDNPSGPFTLNVQNGTNYTHAGAVITPAANYYGDLSIPITVSDGTNPSAVFNFQLTVNPVNDAPVITGQDPISIDEGEAFELTLDLLNVTDADPEDVYPDDFTLTVLSGSQYSVIGTTITPVANFNGVLEVPVFVRDGTANSNTFTLDINVGAVNDPPVITGQAIALTISEDQSVVLALNQLNVTDPDNPPGDLSLVVQSGTNYTFSGLTVTPAANFNGALQVKVVVTDGDLNSAPFNMLVTVTAVNDAPVITGQNPVTTTEDVPITLSLADLVVTDPDADDPYPGAFTMQASPGANYTVSGLTVTPALDFTGTLSVPVVVNDGTVNSNTFNLQVQVTDENDIPVITGQTPLPLVTAEDTPVTIQLSNLTVTDTDDTYPTGFSIVIQSGANYTYSGATVTPALDYTGTLMVTLRVNDGQNNSAAFAFEILVSGDNDPPTITGQKQLSVAEDQSLEIKLTDLIVTDPDPEDEYPEDFTLTVQPGTNYTVSGTTITPAANYFGPLSVPVRVNDGVNNSAPFNLVVTVNAVNDPPSIAPIENVIIAENTEDYVVQVTGISPGPMETQNLNFSVTSSNSSLLNPTFTYNGTGSTATITLNPAPNQTGTVTLTVKVIDPGLLEGTQLFTVRIEDINAAPTLDPIAFGPIPEDSPVQTIPLTGISAGPGESQVLTLSAVADKPELFETFTWSYTSPQPTGSLTILPKPNAYGDVVITVTVTDNGSNDGPHVNFITRQFTLEITPVADPPIFISEPVELALIGEPYEYAIEAADTDPGAVITLEASQAPGWLSITQVSNGKATLSGTPPPGSAGSVLVSIKATDDTDAEVFQNFTLIVDTRPVVSDFSITAEEDVPRIIEKIRFDAAFSDADNDIIQKVRIEKLPPHGQVFVGTQAINEGQEISASDVANFTYKGLPDYYGEDTIVWNAFDGHAYAAAPARIFITLTPVNDAPVIVNLETVTLTVNAGEGPVQISTEFEVEDVDNEFLTGAEIGFRRQNFVAEEDLLIFDNTPKITGDYDPETGILQLTGTATVAEYNAAIRSIRYDNVSSVFSSEEVIKNISYSVSDGTVFSVPRDREIRLIDTFEELVIPNGFTPNSDGDNDLWLITNLDRHVDASVKVYTIMGQIVYESDGLYQGWDGTYNGQVLPTDTYYYTIDLNLPFRKKVYKGAVTLLR